MVTIQSASQTDGRTDRQTDSSRAHGSEVDMASSVYKRVTACCSSLAFRTFSNSETVTHFKFRLRANRKKALDSIKATVSRDMLPVPEMVEAHPHEAQASRLFTTIKHNTKSRKLINAIIRKKNNNLNLYTF